MNEKKYDFINFNNLHLRDYKIRPIRKNDIQKIRKWRNEQIDILRQNKEISVSEQNQYYKISIKKSFHVNAYTLSIRSPSTIPKSLHSDPAGHG